MGNKPIPEDISKCSIGTPLANGMPWVRQYQVGGSLTKDAPSYVIRQADRQLYEALQQGEVCYVLDSRQMGKSSLLIHTLNRIEKEGNLTSAIDLTYLGSEFTNPLQWYKGLVAQLWSGFGLNEQVNLKSWWQEKEDISYLQRLGEFIDLILNSFPQQKIFIFIDELDRIQSLDFPVDDFLALIRYCYNQRAFDPAYQRINFALFGVAAPKDLIRNKRLTPFNIGRAIALEGFKLSETEPLMTGLSDKFSHPRAVMQQILKWTNGQPFLTQKLCQLSIATDISSGSIPDSVDRLVQQHIVNNWQTQDEPEHLKTIRDRLLHNPRTAGRLLGIYQQILRCKEIENNNSPEQIELLLSGLVIKDNNYLRVKNLIYQSIFNAKWVEQQLNNLRPYRVSFEAWSKDGRETHLLKGLALKEALAWAEDKQLSDSDYRYLAASQQLVQQSTERDLVRVSKEKEQTQFALNAVKEAHRLIIVARHHARQKVKRLRIAKSWIAIVAIAVFVLTICLRQTGLLQGLELTMLDLYFQQRPINDVSSRLTIITIDESDIQQLSQFPVSDRILVRSLNKLIDYQPRVIGLNLYRDLPIPPGETELQKLFESTPNLIGIKKVVGAKIPPPPSLAENRVGFADLIFDRDGTIRRALLSIRDDNRVERSFALKLALEYLQTEGIKPQPLLNSAIALGKATLIPFQSNDGGYIRADEGGYQNLINYRGILNRFTHYSLSDLLASNVPTEAVRDRIVLIGSITDTTSDLSPTPYSRFSSGKQMAWVIIHANIVSQLLDAAIDGKAMLRTMSEGSEWLSILLGAVVGAYLSWRVRVLWRMAIALSLISVMTILLTFITFLQGWWLPVVPVAIALVISAVLIAILTQRQLANMQLRETVGQLIIISQEQPTVRQVAFELLKQESQNNQELIEQAISPHSQSSHFARLS